MHEILFWLMMATMLGEAVALQWAAAEIRRLRFRVEIQQETIGGLSGLQDDLLAEVRKRYPLPGDAAEKS